MLDAQLAPAVPIAKHTAAQTLFFIDHEVLDPEILISGLASGTTVHYLPPVGNPFDAIAAAVEAHEHGARKLVLLSHGSTGMLRLCGRKIDIRALRRDVRRLKRIRSALAQDAEITLMACAAGAGAIGRAFLRTLEDSLNATVHGANSEIGGAMGWEALPAVRNHINTAALAAYPHRLSNLVEGNQIVATDETLTGGSGVDFISGYGGNDLLQGFAENDVLRGGSGNDTLSGGSGIDTMSGGDGDDLLVLATGELPTSAGLAEVIDGGAGNDVLTLGSGSHIFTHTLISNVETISGSSGGDTITAHASTAQNYALGGGNDVISGSSGADTISGEAGSDSIFGLGGSDVISGGDGDDSLAGGDGTDILVGGSGNDTYFGTAAQFNGDTISGLAAGDQIIVSGNTSLATSLNGNTVGSTISLGSETINLSGSAANLQISGSVSSGNSVLTITAVPAASGSGGSGSGSVTVSDSSTENTTGGARTITNSGSSSGSAAIVENTGNGGNVVTATLPPSTSILSEGPASAQTGTDAVTTLVSAIDGRDSSGESQLISGAQTYLNKLATNSTLDIRTLIPTTTSTTSSGDPIVISGSSSSGQSEAFVIDLRSMPSGTTLQLDNIEFASVIGQATVSGGAGQNFVTGDDASQFISLGAEDDTLMGGGGDDTIGSGYGEDILYGNQGADSVFGGGGMDTLYGGQDGDTVLGNNDDDVLYGNRGGDTLFGGENEDAVFGGQDNDIVYGNQGEDTLAGNLGDDQLYGGQGNDIVSGSEGNDFIAGNKGDDTLVGGSGADTFYFEFEGGNDQVSDFTAGEDTLAFESGLTYSAADSGGNTVITTSDGGTITLIGVSKSSLGLAATAGWDLA
ncbi:DUF4347 domain-containing protein [Nisaea acidiphila]|uniref:DUF4347 domain-containing protein n=1 Tax=Nisaea acidiphila TaxID=1862145 RepID=A0A9J7AMC7_9PROT|nr:DUF4347 domain-containing protein [Nisaea acidiphila]UUX48310.1 DUF4347 domain-containing protein [Nisaea acidiphila]